MPPKKGHRLSVDSHRRAKRKGAREQKGSKNRTHHRLWGDESVFPPRLASRPRPGRFHSLRPLEKAQVPRPAAAPQAPRRRPRRLLHRRVTAKPPLPPLCLPRYNLPRPSLQPRPLAPPAPRCKSCQWSRAPSPTALRRPRPPTPLRRPRRGCSLARPHSAQRRPPCEAPRPPCSDATPT